MAPWTIVVCCVFLLCAVALLWGSRHSGRLHVERELARRQTEVQLAETVHLVGELGAELARLRADARQEAERARADVAQTQARYMGMLQQQATDVVGLVQRELHNVRGTMHERMTQLNHTVGEQLGGHAKLMGEVRGQLGGLRQAAQNMESLGRDIASLQDILRAPKLRGNLGELLLGELLGQVLPTSAFALQHRLPGAGRADAVVVDAVVKLAGKLVPIDSKFPLESFQRLLSANGEAVPVARKAFLEVVRGHVDAIADKYIRPEVGTYDFALMYLPAENVYYEAVVREDSENETRSIVAHAAKRKVIPVSPNTFYAYLLTISYGLKGLQIEAQAQTISTELAGLSRSFALFTKAFEKVGRNIDLAHRGYDEVARRADRLGMQMARIAGEGARLETSTLPEALPESPQNAELSA